MHKLSAEEEFGGHLVITTMALTVSATKVPNREYYAAANATSLCQKRVKKLIRRAIESQKD